MDLRKTMILPSDDAALARQLFKHAVFDTVDVLLVVLGTGASIETLVQRADKLAGRQEDPRRVIWARSPGDIKPVVDGLKGEQIVLGSTRAFSLSLTDTVRDVITTAEPEPDLVRILEAFVKAEAENSDD